MKFSYSEECLKSNIQGATVRHKIDENVIVSRFDILKFMRIVWLEFPSGAVT